MYVGIIKLQKFHFCETVANTLMTFSISSFLIEDMHHDRSSHDVLLLWFNLVAPHGKESFALMKDVLLTFQRVYFMVDHAVSRVRSRYYLSLYLQLLTWA